MIRTLIVDDEHLIRLAVKQMIDWPSLGIELVGEAAVGPEALEMIQRLRPDLALLDIDLPVMNGIEICRALKERNIPTKVVILTGYDTFDYIQQCLRLGVLDYVVKPIEERELYRALQSACQSISQERQVQEMLLEQGADLAPGPSQEERIQELLSDAGDAWVCAANIDGFAQRYRSSREQAFALKTTREQLQALFDQSKGMSGLHLESNGFIWISKMPLLKTKQQLTGLQARLCDANGISISVGLCTTPVTLGNYPACRRIALSALAKKFYSGPGSCNEAGSEVQEWNASVPPLDLPAIRNLLLNRPKRAFLAHLDASLAEFMKLHPSRQQLTLYCMRIINVILDFGAIATPGDDDQLGALERCDTAEELKTAMLEICASLVDRVTTRNQVNPLIHRAISYIQENYADPELSLGGIAGALRIAPGYLGRVFKQSQGVTITKFITRYRIDRAMELLIRGEYRKIADVALAVGYHDALYFSKEFKRLKGVSPSKYL